MASRALRRRSSYRAINDHRKEKRRPFLRFLLVLFVMFTMLTAGASAGTLFFAGESLPSLHDFTKRFQFENTLILASDGKTQLYDLANLSKSKGRRVVEPLVMPGHTTKWYRQHGEDWLVGAGGRGIPLSLQNSTIASEDATFYNNPGFDPVSIVRAGYDDVVHGHVVSGASTITQQLIKQYLLTDKQTFTRKLEEVVLAAELTQKYPKTKILWYYLNSVFYGNLAVGAQAAAQTYFHKNVWKLDAAQSAFLAGLPEAPTTYNPVNNRPAAMGRMEHVVHLMDVHGFLLDGNGRHDPSLGTAYLKEARSWKAFQPPTTTNRYPDFVRYAIDELEHIPQFSKGGKIYTGLKVITSLNPEIQDTAQQIVSAQIGGLGGYNVTDGALVSMDLRPDCYGCILAMVGTADPKGPAGQINMADTPRQPGSSFKPFNYEFAFQHGLGPASVVDDGPLSLPDDGNPEDGGVYAPLDYDQQWHGEVSLRTALDNSLNIPAIKVELYSMNQVAAGGKHGQIGSSIGQNAIRMGISDLFKDNPNCCGYATTLGGMERGVRLVQETSAYGAFGTMGHPVRPIAIKEVRDRRTNKLLWSAKTQVMQPEMKKFVIPAADAYLMDNVLSDNASRCTPTVCEFEPDSPLYLPGYTAAAKTGTTNAFTDNWTVGYTPDLVTGVWVGNADNSQMVGSTGITGAAPIWNQFMLYALPHLGIPSIDFPQPAGVEYGSTCLSETAYGPQEASYGYDIYAGQLPWCDVDNAYQNHVVGSTTTQGAAVAAPTVAPTVVQYPTPTPIPYVAPTQTPYVAPTAVPQATSPPVFATATPAAVP